MIKFFSSNDEHKSNYPSKEQINLVLDFLEDNKELAQGELSDEKTREMWETLKTRVDKIKGGIIWSASHWQTVRILIFVMPHTRFRKFPNNQYGSQGCI